jgi:hypothetical protein
MDTKRKEDIHVGKYRNFFVFNRKINWKEQIKKVLSLDNINNQKFKIDLKYHISFTLINTDPKKRLIDWEFEQTQESKSHKIKKRIFK